MPLAAGTRLGPYEVLSPLGAGGMGEVFRARDARLQRDVAIKVLPASFAADPERLRRFEQEARATSALNHPNILTIYDIGFHDGAPYIVAELLQGEELRAALAQGALPMRAALAHAHQIALGLAAAHDQGIVHRDLKPENIFVTSQGRVKILDFGLAKLRPMLNEPVGSEIATQHPATEPGVVLGTVGYMAPEQVRGREADHRADIFSLGVILREMLSGQRTFAGESSVEVLGAILKEEPGDLSETNARISPQLDRVVRRCLEKNPDARFHSAHDLAFALDALATPSSSGGRRAIASDSTVTKGPPRMGWRERAGWVLALLLAGVAIRALTSRPAVPERQATRLAFLPPDNVAFDATPRDFLAVSPSGKLLVFTGRSPSGKRQLWVRALDALEAQPLPGTEDAVEPFWSPDSRSIGFGAQGKLQRVDLSGGRPKVLADAARLVGGSWSRTGTIVFVTDWNGLMLQVSAQGGETTVVRPPGPARSPVLLPDGRHYLYSINPSDNPQILVGSLGSQESKVLVSGAAARYAPPGWLLFVRDGALLAQPFDADRLELSGDPVTIPTGPTELYPEGLPFSVSDNGVLVWPRNLTRDYQLAWFDRAGRPLGAAGRPTRLTNGLQLSLSPDGTRVVIANREQQPETRGIWVTDLARNISTRLSAFGQVPAWAPDGTRVAWQGKKGERIGLYQRAASGVSEEELLIERPNLYTSGYTPDGRFLLCYSRGEKTRLDILALPLSGDRKLQPVLQTEFDETWAQVSPDGRWLAYRSDPTGTSEIYVQPFTSDGRVGADRWRLSTSGGTQPRFRSDSRELFYLADDGQLMAVALSSKGATLDYGPPQPLFKPRMLPRGAQAWYEYDVSRDGQRFLIGTAVDTEDAPPPSAMVVLDWSAELQGKAAAR